MKKLLYFFVLFLSVSLIMYGCAQDGESASSESEYPSEEMELTIAFGPGGGNDLMARTLVDIIEQHELYPESIVPENKDGGSGAVGWGYVANQKEDPYHMSTTSGSFITTPLQSEPGWTYEDFTPIALMATDDPILVVNDDSEYETLDEIIEAAKTEELVIGGVGVANTPRMITETLKEEEGLNLEYVPFNEEGQLLSGLTSENLDVILSFPNGVLGQLESGDMRAIAYTGEERLSDFPDIPTFIEEGIEITFPMPRGLILPGDVDEDVREWWIDTMKEVAETDEWSKYIEENHLTEKQLYGDDFSEYLSDTSEEFKNILDEIDVSD